MARAYNVVGADGHILEPLDLWDRYIDPEFRERRPRFVIYRGRGEAELRRGQALSGRTPARVREGEHEWRPTDGSRSS
jgi:hypothetical protein